MNGRKCFVLDLGDAELLAETERQLAGTVLTERIRLQDFRAITPAPDAELGTFLLPFRAATDTVEAENLIVAMRAQRAHVSVLGMAANEAAACARLHLPPLDDVTGLHLAVAAAKVARFVDIVALERQHRAFRAYLDTSVDGYWIWDVQQDLLEWSARTREMLGMETGGAPVAIAGFLDLVHPHDRDRVLQAVDNHFRRGAPYRNISFRMRSRNGSYGDYVANGQAIRDQRGQPLILVGSVTDRTRLMQVERQLENTQKRFTVLFHRMNDAAVLADTETGTIVEANEPAERLWGKATSELVGAHQTSLHPPILNEASRKAFEDHVAALMQNNRASIQVPILRADGTEVPTEISSSLIEIDGRQMILGVFRDITERVRAEHDIRERDAQLQLQSHLASMGTLAAGVAHEINNPLTYLLGNLEFLKDSLIDGGESAPETREALEAAITGGTFLREIVSDLKAISRVDSAESQCAPAEVIRIATRMAMSDLRHRAVLELDLREVPPTPMSSARLTQVVLNLFSNAARSFATTDRRQNRIRVTVAPQGAGTRVVITDNGSGIAPEDLKRVFEPFFSRNRIGGGTGLGLSICRRILTEVGGSLSITSDGATGTTVAVDLPGVEQRPVPSLTRPAQAGFPRGRGRIMVLDDDVLVSQLIEQVIRKDCDVTVFNSPLQALRVLEDGVAFDAILCDLMMPEMNGAAFHAAVQALPGRKPPFLFITGGGVTEDCVELERRMAREGRLFFKPFKAGDLRAKVADMLSASAAEVQCEQDCRDDQSCPARQAGGLQANPAVLADLEEIMGASRVTAQFERLAAELAAARHDILLCAEARQADAVVQVAHRVAGAAGLMGLEPLSRALWSIEHAARDGDLDAIPAPLAEVEALMAALGQLIAQRQHASTSGPVAGGAPAPQPQSSTTLPESPERMVAKPS